MSVSLESLMRDQPAGEPRLLLFAQLLSFILIGGLAALGFICVSAAAVGTFHDIPAWLVSALCYAAFIVPVYLLHRRFAFRSTADHNRALPRYVTVQLCGLLLATVFSYVAYGVIGMPTLVAAALVIGLTSGVNFLVLRRWAFGAV
jgi:putative flippase GtrA